nr:CDP-diacylglycerol--serine O-phosphatidyltransferase 1-like isoform X1 [Ipomoea batatas]
MESDLCIIAKVQSLPSGIGSIFSQSNLGRQLLAALTTNDLDNPGGEESPVSRQFYLESSEMIKTRSKLKVVGGMSEPWLDSHTSYHWLRSHWHSHKVFGQGCVLFVILMVEHMSGLVSANNQILLVKYVKRTLGQFTPAHWDKDEWHPLLGPWRFL